jgi:hypothetical protein
MGQKKCNKCGQLKDYVEFNKYKANKDGLDNRCRVCKNEIRRNSYTNLSPEARKAFLLRGEESKKVYARSYKGKLAKKISELKRVYSITMDDYNKLLVTQDGKCAICRQFETRSKNGVTFALCVDHNHKTKQLRGLLCQKHNHAIGMFYEDINRLLSAIEYLRAERVKLDKDVLDNTAKVNKSDTKRAWWLFSKYNMLVDDYNKTLFAQNGVCAICRCPETHTQKGILTPLCVDHDHKTNEIRGLLCRICNKGLGLFNDDIDLILSAIEYLRKYRREYEDSQLVI